MEKILPSLNFTIRPKDLQDIPWTNFTKLRKSTTSPFEQTQERNYQQYNKTATCKKPDFFQTQCGFFLYGTKVSVGNTSKLLCQLVVPLHYHSEQTKSFILNQELWTQQKGRVTVKCTLFETILYPINKPTNPSRTC